MLMLVRVRNVTSSLVGLGFANIEVSACVELLGKVRHHHITFF